MKKFVLKVLLCLGIALLTSSNVCASNGGSHSHGQHALDKASDNAVVTYKETKDGVDAYLEFCNYKILKGNGSNGFLVKCHAKAYLIDSKTGESLKPAKILLRATIGHNQFRETVIFRPVNNNKMQADLFVKNEGEHHYLLIAEIEGAGLKEFHFHHTF